MKAFKIKYLLNGQEKTGITLNPIVGDTNNQCWDETLTYSTQYDNSGREFLQTPSFGAKGVFGLKPIVTEIIGEYPATDTQISKMRYGV